MRILISLFLLAVLSGCATKPDIAVYSKAIGQNDRNKIESQLKAGQDVDARLDQNGTTALQKAVSEGNLDLADYLVQHGANPFARNVAGLSAIDLALRGNTELKVWAATRIEKGRSEFSLAVEAIKQGDVAAFSGLVASESFYLYTTDGSEREENLAHIAVRQGCDDCLATLGTQKFDWRRTDNKGYSPISYTVWLNRLSALDQLLKLGANPNDIDNDGWTLLMVAVDKGFPDIVERLLMAGADLGLQEKDGWTALHFTANQTNDGGDALQAQIAQMLIDAGAPLDVQNTNGSTTSNVAALNNRPLVLEVLLRAGANPNIASPEGWTPLMNAVNQGHLDVVDLILRSPVDLEARNKTGWTALHLTANQSNQGGDAVQAKIARKLISAGAALDPQNNDGYTAINLTAWNDRPMVLDVLLKAGANPNISDNDGWTPLMTAVNQGHPVIVDRLLKAGVDLGAQSKNGWTALHFTANQSNKGGDALQAEIAQKLVKAGAPLDARNNSGSTAIKVAVMNGRFKVLDVLLKTGANPNIADNDGWTPLMSAVNQGQLYIVDQLLKAKADLAAQDKSGWTALHLTANASNEGGDPLQAKIAQKLLKAGAKVNALNYELATPLMLAAMNDRLEVARVLLQHGASTTIRNKMDRTAEDEARRADNFRIVALLLEHQAASPEVKKTTKTESGINWPARPAKRPGVVSCNTRCFNGDCYRTYDDGRQVRFQAQQIWNPLSGSFEWDSGGC